MQHALPKMPDIKVDCPELANLQTQRAEQAGDGWEPRININPQEGSFQSDRTGSELDSGVDGTTLQIATNITDPHTSNE